jgi:Ca2+-binding RTX toxin-like protein
MQLFGGDGADTFNVNTTSGQTIVGGNDSSDAGDSVFLGSGADLVFGNGGNDTLDTGQGSDTVVCGFGNDCVNASSGTNVVFGNQGNDLILTGGLGSNDSVWGGLGNDSVNEAGSGAPLLFGNEGADTLLTITAAAATIVGGQDSADGADSIVDQTAGTSTLWAFGNGGADTINLLNASVTVIAGQGNDSLIGGASAQALLFGNEGNDTLNIGSAGAGVATVFGGQGNDSLWTNVGRDSIQGNEGNDTLRGDFNIDTISGGTGNDVFAYGSAADDGNNAAGGGPVELITDVNWSVDRFATATAVTFAANITNQTGADLAAQANSAIAGAFALNGSTGVVAAQFSFNGHTYLAIDQAGTGTFSDTQDLLLDITGVTGTIANSNFIPFP